MLGKRVEVAGKIEDIIVVNTSGNWAKSGERDGPSTCRGVVDKLLNTLSQMGAHIFRVRYCEYPT